MAANSVCGWRWWIHIVYVLVLMNSNNNSVFGCFEDEKIALLKLKHLINHHMQNSSSVYYDKSESWRWIDEERDCCRWNWVTCHLSSNRIINISIRPYNDWFFNEASMLLDASMFQPFQQLQNLTFGYSNLKGLDGQLKLPKLQVLDLNHNIITHVPLLGELPSLKYLDLSYNTISHVPLLGELLSLKYLDLSHNGITHGFEELRNLTDTLEFLNLNAFNYNNLGKIPPSILALTSLKMLGLSLNRLNGSLPQGLCALKNLQELDLSMNEFEGVIPTCLSNLTSLRVLDLYQNKLSGTIPSNVFSTLYSLQYISLSDNNFDGSFSFTSFANNSKLEIFELNNGNPNLKVDIPNDEWKHSTFQLKILRLSNCGCGVIPSFLLSQYDLRYVDLSYNGMTGEYPSWLLANNSRLETLSLKHNFFTGRLELQLDSFNTNLVYLDVSMNHFSGEIPTFIWSIYPNLTYLDMSSNSIEGSIPFSVGNMSQLYYLDLSDNLLSGEIPGVLFSKCEELVFLKLSYNKLQGNFLPKNVSKSSKLSLLYLDSNHLSVDLTHGRQETLRLSFGGLKLFDISNNSISGRFPDWISELSTLLVLNMSKNHFEGKLPTSFCNLTMLKYIDLSWNNFSDTLPLCTNLPSLLHLHLQGNIFHGPLPVSLSRSSSIVTLNVRDNNFSGFIPTWISSLSQLVILLLNGNAFHGSIPSELCQMKNLNILDLSANNLSGYVPPCLSRIPFGKIKLWDVIFVDEEENWRSFGSYSYENQLHISQFFSDEVLFPEDTEVREKILFNTKSMYESYRGDILDLMSGIDLSHNKLTGPIPFLTDNWDHVHSLNLSYNHFNGSIPLTVSRLKALESLDLSHNMLSGEIPSQIIGLNFLSVFSVAYNNLSGPTPTMTRQFGTFNARNYEGNPLLYGCPLDLYCKGRSPLLQQAKPYITKQEQNDFSYEDTFLCSFFGSFVVSCIGAFVYFYFNTNVPETLLVLIGIEKVHRWRTIRFV